MKAVSRSALGIAIGSIIVFGFSATAIYIIKVLCDFGNLTEEEKRGNKDVWSTAVTQLYVILIICVIATIISGLLIAGIIKKRHSLMKPWLFCAFAGIVCHIFRLIVSLFSGSLTGAPAFIFIVCTLGLQICIFYFIFMLHKDISDSANESEHEETVLNLDNYRPPSYGELERKGEV